MLFRKSGNSDLPTIILLHGGGLSWWSLKEVAKILESDFHVVTPIIDGHGEAGEEIFISIEDSAEKLIHYIDSSLGGRVFALGGLSIGAQIVTDVLSKRSDIAQYAVIESALVYPIKGTKALTAPMNKLFYGLIKERWFSEIQAKALFVPQVMLEQYYQDSLKLSKDSLCNIALSNGSYRIKNGLSSAKTAALILVGEKERKIMIKSAAALHEAIHNSELHILPNMGHGELSLAHPDEYAEIICAFFRKSEKND